MKSESLWRRISTRGVNNSNTMFRYHCCAASIHDVARILRKDGGAWHPPVSNEDVIVSKPPNTATFHNNVIVWDSMSVDEWCFQSPLLLLDLLKILFVDGSPWMYSTLCFSSEMIHRRIHRDDVLYTLVTMTDEHKQRLRRKHGVEDLNAFFAYCYTDNVDFVKYL